MDDILNPGIRLSLDPVPERTDAPRAQVHAVDAMVKRCDPEDLLRRVAQQRFDDIRRQSVGAVVRPEPVTAAVQPVEAPPRSSATELTIGELSRPGVWAEGR